MIYLDNNATTRMRDEVLEAMLPWLGEAYGNPSGGYRFGKEAREAIEAARAEVAALIGARPEEIVFTSGGTESDNTAIRSALASRPGCRHLVTTTAEHSAVEELAGVLEDEGVEVTRVPVSRAGLLDPEKVAAAIRPGETAVVSVVWANNETGVLAPIPEIASVCSEAGVFFHSDAVQAAGKMPVDASTAGAHLLALSGHKIHGPKGVGALFVSGRVRFKPWLHGGGQEGGRRSGTENVAGIVGFGAAAALARGALASGLEDRLAGLRDRFERGVLERVPEVEVNGAPDRRLPNTSNLYFKGVDAEGLLILLDERGLCCSPGSACATGTFEPSRVILAMGHSKERARSSVRFSFSDFNTGAEADEAVAMVAEAAGKIRAARPPAGSRVIARGSS